MSKDLGEVMYSAPALVFAITALKKQVDQLKAERDAAVLAPSVPVEPSLFRSKNMAPSREFYRQVHPKSANPVPCLTCGSEVPPDRLATCSVDCYQAWSATQTPPGTVSSRRAAVEKRKATVARGRYAAGVA